MPFASVEKQKAYRREYHLQHRLHRPQTTIACRICTKLVDGIHGRKYCSKDCYLIAKQLTTPRYYLKRKTLGLDKISDFKYRNSHKETIKLKCSKWRKSNMEHVRAYDRKRFKESPNKRFNNSQYSIRRSNIVGKFTISEWTLLKWIFSERCAYCGEQKVLTIDHVIPITKGGTNYIENILPACKSCNSSKNNSLHWNLAKEIIEAGGYLYAGTN